MKQKLHLIFLSCLITATLNAQKVVPATEFGKNGLFKTEVNLDEAYLINQQIQTDGKILASVTYTDDFGYNTSQNLYRINTSGKLDASFGNGGVIAIGRGAGGGVIRGGFFDLQPDGKIVTANLNVDRDGFAPTIIVIERFLSNGHVDSSFGKNGVVTYSNFNAQQLYVRSIKVKPDGKILITGSYTIPFTARGGTFMFELNSAGGAVKDFGVNGLLFLNTLYEGGIRTTLVLPDNSFVNGNAFYDSAKASYSTCLAFYKPDGSIDNTKGDNGIVLNNNVVPADVVEYESVNIGLAVQKDGKILEYTDRNNSSVLYRYKPDGTINGGFGIKGKARVSFATVQHAVQVQDNQKSLSDNGNVIKRFLYDGTPDISFGNNGSLSFTQLDESFGFCFNAKRLYGIGTTYDPNTFVPLLEIIAYNFCDTCSIANAVAESSDMNNATAENSTIKIYPNPVKDKMIISGLSNKTITQLQLSDGSGKILKAAATGNNIYEWNIQSLPAGIYFIKIINGNQQVQSFKILKQ